MKLIMNPNCRLKTAVSFIILLLLTACTVTETRPTVIPTVVTPSPEATAVPTETTQPTPTPLPPPTAVLPRYIEPTATPTPDYPILPSENSLRFTLQNQFGGVPQAVLVDGSVAYLAVGPRLVAIDITDPTTPQLMSQSPLLNDMLHDIVLDGTLVYGAAGRAGLMVLDVADPTNIQLVNAGPGYFGANPPYAREVARSGNRLFITTVGTLTADFSFSIDLVWFDLADPNAPTFAGSMPLKDPEGFSATRDLLFMATDAGIQVADPQNPTQELSRIGAEEEIYRVYTAVHHNRLYLVYMGQQPYFTIYDLTDPTNPQVVPQDQPVSLNFVSAIARNNNILATSNTFGEFGHCGSQITIVDIAELAAPRETAEFNPQNCVSAMVGSGQLLYVAGLSGLQIFNTSDPANLQLLGRYTNPAGIQTVEDILPGQPTSYVLTNEGRGAIVAGLDLSQTPPILLSQTEPYTNGLLLQLMATNQALVVPVWNNGASIFDTASPTDLTLLYEPQEEGELLGSLYGTALVSNMLYMPLQEQYTFVGNIGVFDLQDPTHPQQISMVKTDLSTIETLVTSDSYLYLLGDDDNHRNLVIIDIHTPSKPTLVSTLVLPEQATRLAVVGSTVYAICDGYNCQSLTTIDVTDAERPFILNQWHLPFDVVDLEIVGQQLYTTSSDNTVRALDVSQPHQPRMVGAIALPGNYGRLTVTENALYVSAGSAGLYVLTITP